MRQRANYVILSISDTTNFDGETVNWNVYKVFKNGKRAKAPLMTFERKGKLQEVTHYFNENIKKNFNEKNRDLNFLLLCADQSQERKEEKNHKIEEEILKKQALVLGRLLKKANIKTKYKVGGGLIFARATHWKWQWCALEGGTNQYIAALSPRFDTATEAEKWLNQQIQNLK